MVINQFDAFTSARAELERNNCDIKTVVRKRQRPVIQATCNSDVVAWPVVEISVKESGIKRIVRTSRIHGCLVIWSESLH